MLLKLSFNKSLYLKLQEAQNTIHGGYLCPTRVPLIAAELCKTLKFYNR